MASLNPVKILKNETVEKEGEEAHLSPFTGATAIGDSIQSTLGSEDIDKISVANGHNSGDVQVTNKVSTILKNLGVENPAALTLEDLYRIKAEGVDDVDTREYLCMKFIRLARQRLENMRAICAEKTKMDQINNNSEII